MQKKTDKKILGLRGNFSPPKYLHLATILLLIIGLLHSCQEDSAIIENEKSDISLSELISIATQRYNQTVAADEKTELRTTGVDGSGIQVAPFWTNSKGDDNSTYKALETEAASEKRFNFITPESQALMNEMNRFEFNFSKTNFVYLQHKKTGDEWMFLMTIVPDASYLKETKFDPYKKMSYLKRDKKFSGFIFYHNLEGEFVNGVYYRQGEVISTVQFSNNAFPIGVVQTRSGCSEFPLHIMGEVCGAFSVGDGPIQWDCRPAVWLSTSLIVCSGGHDSGYDGAPLPNGGGGNGTPAFDPQKGAPLASKIVRNSNMSKENWERLERMFEKIMSTCMGRGLYNELASKLGGKTFIFQFGSNGGSFDVNTSTITLDVSGGWNIGRSNNLMHELMHAYQAYGYLPNDPNYTRSLLNMEVEARYAQYLYVSSLPEYAGSEWERLWEEVPSRKDVARLSIYIDSKGRLKSGANENDLVRDIKTKVVESIRNVVDTNGNKPYFNFQYMDSMYGISNFRNLQTILKNC